MKTIKLFLILLPFHNFFKKQLDDDSYEFNDGNHYETVIISQIKSTKEEVKFQFINFVFKNSDKMLQKYLTKLEI